MVLVCVPPVDFVSIARATEINDYCPRKMDRTGPVILTPDGAHLLQRCLAPLEESPAIYLDSGRVSDGYTVLSVSSYHRPQRLSGVLFPGITPSLATPISLSVVTTHSQQKLMDKMETVSRLLAAVLSVV
ncbi:hypothetical protein BaRGS_00010447 [Batillaria attramentaria]|uniref:Uncharacterized protein n=1 Tax=Batillaria attramentaria TaxID=370345 RepID=A0ABD0LFT9_9CAEN